MIAWLDSDWLHWVYLTGGVIGTGLGLAVIRCALDYTGIWPMKYKPGGGPP